MYFAVFFLLCLAAHSQASYDVTFYTSNVAWAGTDASVWVKFYGSKGTSGKIYVRWVKHHLERNRKDTYTINGDYGFINALAIGHNRGGSASGWHLGWVKVRDNTRGTESSNYVKKWIAKNTVTVKFRVNGGWSTWSTGTCSATCGRGSQTLTRTCNNPKSQNGGSNCVGADKQTTTCKTRECPVNGGWSAWVSGPCNAKCGPGVMTLTRRCNTPLPRYGGTQCSGSNTQTKPCKIMACAVNGGWSEWGDFGACSATCGQGVQTRSRKCSNPAPKDGGQTCPGASKETKKCVVKECPPKCPINVPKEKRFDGGWPGITKEECLKQGNCFDKTFCKECNWCYISPEKLTGKECPITAPPAAKKVDAGIPGVTATKCRQAGQCWHQGAGPWCYKNPNA